MLLHAGYAEVGRLGPQREHEMLVGELPAACHHAPLFQIDAVQRSPPEAGAEPDQGPAQGCATFWVATSPPITLASIGQNVK